MKLSDRKIDLQEARGRRVGQGHSRVHGDLELKVRGSGNKDWARMEQKLIAAVPRQRRVNGLEPEDRLRINGILCSRHIAARLARHREQARRSRCRIQRKRPTNT